MSLFERAMSSVNKIKEEKGVAVPISESKINELIKKTEKVKDTAVKISNGFLVVTGKVEVEKTFIKKDISFEIILEPVRIEKRELLFQLKEFKPMNFNFINKILFNKPPYLTYKDSYIKIDFNCWDIVKKIPFGNIKSYQLTDGKITLTIGL